MLSKGFLFSVLSLLLSLAAGFCGALTETGPGEASLKARMIACDTTLTLHDYGLLYYDFLGEEGSGIPDKFSREEFVREVSSIGDFAGAVALINRYDDPDLRRELAMDLIHILYLSGADTDQAREYLDRLADLVSRARVDGSVGGQEAQQEITAIMDYFLELVFQALY